MRKKPHFTYTRTYYVAITLLNRKTLGYPENVGLANLKTVKTNKWGKYGRRTILIRYRRD